MKKLKIISPQIKEKKSILSIAIFVVLTVYFLALFVPIVWAIYSSFNDPTAYDEFYLSADAPFPTKLTFENFKIALVDFRLDKSEGQFSFPQMIVNSIIYTIGSAFFYTLTPCLVAYCAARFKFKFSKILYAFVIVTMALPIVGTMPSEWAMLKTLHLDDNFLGMFILRMNFLSINFLIFHAQFEMIPMTYSEAAKVDGASNFRIMTTVIFPQAFPTMVTIFLLSFLTFWNDYQIPRVYMPSYPTVSEGLWTFGQLSLDFEAAPIKLAGFIGLTLPIVITFALLNRFLKLNVSTGGIKG